MYICNQILFNNHINTMNSKKLLLSLFLATGLFLASCGDEEPADGCVVCKLNVPLLEDCEITLCDDASMDSSNEAATCVGTIFVGGSGTRAERVAELEDLGFSCN